MKAANDIAPPPGIMICPDIEALADRLGVDGYEVAMIFAKYRDTIKDILVDHTNEMLEEWIYNDGLAAVEDPE